MLRVLVLSLAVLVALGIFAGCTEGPVDETESRRAQPQLIVQVTVDQLRGDLPTRYYDRLGDGGFRYLWEQGVVYSNAHHAHANTETIVGHATIATGAHPSVHGMVGNLWFDRETGFTTYNVEDTNYRLLSAVNASTRPGIVIAHGQVRNAIAALSLLVPKSLSSLCRIARFRPLIIMVNHAR